MSHLTICDIYVSFRPSELDNMVGLDVTASADSYRFRLRAALERLFPEATVVVQHAALSIYVVVRDETGAVALDLSEDCDPGDASIRVIRKAANELLFDGRDSWTVPAPTAASVTEQCTVIIEASNSCRVRSFLVRVAAGDFGGGEFVLDGQDGRLTPEAWRPSLRRIVIAHTKAIMARGENLSATPQEIFDADGPVGLAELYERKLDEFLRAGADAPARIGGPL